MNPLERRSTFALSSIFALRMLGLFMIIPVFAVVGQSYQYANWCVTKPWFDYLMGTRVISSADLQEQNPLGVKLPQPIANWLSSSIEKYFPAKWVEKKPLLVEDNTQKLNDSVA